MGCLDCDFRRKPTSEEYAEAGIVIPTDTRAKQDIAYAEARLNVAKAFAKVPEGKEAR